VYPTQPTAGRRILTVAWEAPPAKKHQADDPDAFATYTRIRGALASAPDEFDDLEIEVE